MSTKKKELALNNVSIPTGEIAPTMSDVPETVIYNDELVRLGPSNLDDIPICDEFLKQAELTDMGQYIYTNSEGALFDIRFGCTDSRRVFIIGIRVRDMKVTKKTFEQQ